MSKTRASIPFVLLFAMAHMAIAGEDSKGPTTRPVTKKKPPPLLKPTYANISYGPHRRQRLNFWRAKSDAPTPLIVHIHGGGWLSGKKAEAVGPHVLADGVSYCAIDYRLATTDVLPASLMDAARAIQFLRYKAREWNIDPGRIAAMGGSAGAASVLWLAFHDDLADPNSENPVLRQSSRLAGAVGVGGQTTLDPFLAKKRIGIAAARHPMIWKTVGASSLGDLMRNWEKYKALSAECSPITHVTRDDPPIFLKYGRMTTVPVTRGDGIHHAAFGIMLKERCDAVGVECTLEIAGGEEPKETSGQFLKRILSK